MGVSRREPNRQKLTSNDAYVEGCRGCGVEEDNALGELGRLGKLSSELRALIYRFVLDDALPRVGSHCQPSLRLGKISKAIGADAEILHQCNHSELLWRCNAATNERALRIQLHRASSQEASTNFRPHAYPQIEAVRLEIEGRPDSGGGSYMLVYSLKKPLHRDASANRDARPFQIWLNETKAGGDASEIWNACKAAESATFAVLDCIFLPGTEFKGRSYEVLRLKIDDWEESQLVLASCAVVRQLFQEAAVTGKVVDLMDTNVLRTVEHIDVYELGFRTESSWNLDWVDLTSGRP